MHIVDLKLSTYHIEAEQQFYTTTLGLPLIQATPDAFSVQVGATRLTFQQAVEPTLYHVAFCIPANKAANARVWLAARVPLLKLDGQDEFTSERWNATSFYFRDAADHILELIAHYDLSNERPGTFGSADLLHISEIGMVFENVAEQVEAWKTTLGLNVYRNSFEENFAAVGDTCGLFITVQRGRNWFPTSTSAVISPVDVVVEGVTGKAQRFEPYPYHVEVR